MVKEVSNDWINLSILQLINTQRVLQDVYAKIFLFFLLHKKSLKFRMVAKKYCHCLKSNKPEQNDILSLSITFRSHSNRSKPHTILIHAYKNKRTYLVCNTRKKKKPYNVQCVYKTFNATSISFLTLNWYNRSTSKSPQSVLKKFNSKTDWKVFIVKSLGGW